MADIDAVLQAHPYQLAVDLGDADLLGRTLLRLGIRPARLASSPALGLTLFGLVGVEPLVAEVRGTPAGAAAPAGAPADLDLIVDHLRALYADRYDGWTPTMGANHNGETFAGLPYIKGSDGGLE